ncbi:MULTISPECIES: serine O-acetyltransferase [Serratia]|uniref:serine O-acetyltransferase n=1 Tax=Serratia sp. PAMC26656 TaxID=2775909 RepID=UPI0018F7064E|nr:serine O-acetyltransferase [Serratia sp. PAMC26656]MBJ7892278.1 serine O-acetyltransferase [Serratia sp. PAMC26656]
MRFFKNDEYLEVGESTYMFNILKQEARQALVKNPLINQVLYKSILAHSNFNASLAWCVVDKLNKDEDRFRDWYLIVVEVYNNNPEIINQALSDLHAFRERDPACYGYLQVMLFFKGFIALQCYRVAHELYIQGKKETALFIQSRMSEVLSIDIHPAAKIGSGIMFDHAHCLVIGETAIIGNNVSLFHSITLGSTGKEHGDRHPKIGDNVTIGAGAKILGNINIGDNAKVAAGSVVLECVLEGKTVAGVPARIVDGQ